MESLGFEVMHVYGLTETYGHVVHCAWNTAWDDLSIDDKAEIKARKQSFDQQKEIAKSRRESTEKND